MTITGHFECLQYFSFKGTLAYFLRKMQTLLGNNLRILSIKNAKFSGYLFLFLWIRTNREIFKSALVSFKISLLKTQKLRKKKLEYGFLVESITIENATFPYSTALAKTNVKTTRMRSAKWTYCKEWSFATN